MANHPTTIHRVRWFNNFGMGFTLSTAASYVQENDIIFIDTGTTTVSIVEFLAHLNAVTVITNSMQAVNSAMNYPNINLICLPGILIR